MIITRVKLDSTIAIDYTVNEEYSPEVHAMRCKELPKPEMYEAFKQLETTFVKVSPMLKDSAKLYISEICIHYLKQSNIVDSYTLKGGIAGNQIMPMEIKADHIPTGINRELQAAIFQIAQEAAEYVKGRRAQQNLFDKPSQPMASPATLS